MKAGGILVLLVGIFMIGIVSGAEINLAASAEGGVATHVQVNDEDDATAYSLTGASGSTSNVYVEAEVMFPSTPVSEIKSRLGTSPGGCSNGHVNYVVDLLVNGVWEEAGSGGMTWGVFDFTDVGYWEDVTGVKMKFSGQAYCTSGGTTTVTNSIYEIRVIGPEPIIETCSDG